MNKVLIIGGIILVIVFVLAVGFFVLVYPQMTAPVTVAPIETPKTQTTPAKTLPQTPTAQTTIEQIKLTVTSPADKATVTASALTISGETVPNADVIINELELKANTAGKFSGKLTLVEGENPIVITAVDANGNYVEKEISVTYEPTN